MKKLTVSEQKKHAILSTAIQLFCKEGFKATSMDQISKSAQVSKRTVYNHFPSKESLFKAILSELLQHFHNAVSVKYQSQVSLRSQLKMIALTQLNLFKEPEFMQLSAVCIAEFILTPSLVADELAELQSTDNDVDIWIKDAIEDHKLKAGDAKFISHQFIGLLKNNFYWPQIFMQQPFPEDEQALQIVESCINMFLAEYQAETPPPEAEVD